MLSQHPQHNGLVKQTASLDRIDSTKGYIKDNIQWIHKDIQRLKLNFSQTKLIELCQLIIDYNHEQTRH